MSRPDGVDRLVKAERVRRLLAPGETLTLTSPTAVSWYLDGSRAQVGPAGDPVLAVVVDGTGERVVAFANEVPRLRAEELPDGIRVTPVPWDLPLAAALPHGAGVRSEAEFLPELRAARTPLLPAETRRFRELGRDAAEALTEAAYALDPTGSENEAAARVAAALHRRGVEPLVVLVGGRSRAVHRHPTPTSAPIGDRVMLVACGRRNGLVANLTRWVRWGEADAAESDAMDRIRLVEAAFLDATRPGATLAEVLAAGAVAYREHGFGPREWERHHQGGVAGYAGRDPRATTATDERIVAGQAFAWNPTAPGAKAEDTVLLGDDGIEILTVDPAWPAVEVAGRARPTELVR